MFALLKYNFIFIILFGFLVNTWALSPISINNLDQNKLNLTLEEKLPHRNRLLFSAESNEKTKALAQKLRFFAVDFDMGVNLNHEYGHRFNEYALREKFRSESGIDYTVKIKRGGQGIKINDTDHLNVVAAWIEELSLSVIILEYKARRGTRATSDFALAYNYEAIFTEVFISDHIDPLLKSDLFELPMVKSVENPPNEKSPQKTRLERIIFGIKRLIFPKSA